MPFYTYRQNNSGGTTQGFETVIIEAGTADEANEAVQEYGVYFDGASRRRGDCPCCGDRWYRAYEGT